MVFFEESVHYTHRAGDNVLPHAHSGYEIILYVNGAGTVSVGNEELPYTDLSVCLIPRRKVHFEHTDRTTDVLTCVLYTDYFSIEEPVVLSGSKYAVAIGKLLPLLGELYDRSRAGLWKAGEKAAEDLLYKISYVTSHLLQLKQNENKKLSNVIIANTKKYILTNWRSDINYSFLAENVGYSYERLRHLFTETTGISLKQYHLGIRLTHAKEYLRSSEARIRDIAVKCGFKSSEQFINHFKKRMGMTPKHYRSMAAREHLDKTFNVTE